MRRNDSHSHTAQHLILGALAGTIVGAVAAAILSSEQCKGLICDAYHQAEQKVSETVHNLGETSHDLAGRFFPQKRSTQSLNLTIGAIAGGILGIATVALLTGYSTKDIRKQVVHTFKSLSNKAHHLEGQASDAVENIEEKISSWIHLAKKLLHNVQDNYSTKNNSHAIDKILDLASVATHFLQNLRK